MDEVILNFASGAVKVVSDEFEPVTDYAKVVGLDADGRIVMQMGEDYTFGLTLCCNAYDKGVEDGVVCRACYSDYDIGSYDAVVVDEFVAI